MRVHSRPGTRTQILWGSIVPGPTWEAGGTRTATRPTSTVFMASTAIIRYNSSPCLDKDYFLFSMPQPNITISLYSDAGNCLDRLER